MNVQFNTPTILFVLVFFFLSAVSVKHISYILMHGSVFNGLRKIIRKRAQDKKFGFAKLNQLFTCKVCMNTQMSIWCVALPVAFSGILPHELLEYPSLGILFFLILIFSVSGLAVLFWNISEYQVLEFERQIKNYEAELRILRLAALGHSGPDSGGAEPSCITLDQLKKILNEISSRCDDIGCGYTKRDCRVETLRKVSERIHSKGDKRLATALRLIVPEYYRDLRDTFDEEDKEELLLRTFQNIVRYRT